MGGIENRGGMDWIDEDFDKGKKNTEEFTFSWDLIDWGFNWSSIIDSVLCPTNRRIEILLKRRSDV